MAISNIINLFNILGIRGSTPAVAAAPGVLNGVPEASFSQLAKEGYDGRTQKRLSLALKILGKLGLEIKTHKLLMGMVFADGMDWRQFALMLCPGMIRRTVLEGGIAKVSCRAALDHVEACLSGVGQCFSWTSPSESESKITLDVLRDLKKKLNNFNKFLALLPPSPKSPPQHQNWRQLPKSISMKSKRNLMQGPRMSVSLSATGMDLATRDTRWFAKRSKEGNNIWLILFNLGNSTHLHLILKYTLNQQLRSFMYVPLPVAEDVFYGEMGEAAFCTLLRYGVDAPMQDATHYEGEDIYDVLCQSSFFGKYGIAPPLGPHAIEYAANEQISGNCTEMATRMLTMDELINHGVPVLQREKYFLNRDFCTLVAGYHALMKDPACDPMAPQLLYDAAQALCLHVRDYYSKKQISEQELICAQAVLHQIMDWIKGLPSPSVPVLPYYPIKEFPREFLMLPTLSKATNSSAFVSSVDQITLSHPRFNANEMDKFKEQIEGMDRDGKIAPYTRSV